MNFATPAEFKPGCLMRKTAPGVCCDLFADKIEVIPVNKWDELIPQVTLRPCVREIFDQDGVGSCASEATTQAVQVAMAFSGRPWRQLSPWYVYHTVSGGRDMGSSIDENLEFARDNGIAPMDVWGREKGWRSKPSAEADEAAKGFRIAEFYDITTVEEFGTALLKGFPVVYGSHAHAKCAVRLIDDSQFEYANSWAPDWGDNGFGREGFRGGVNWGYGAFAVRVVSENQ